MMLKSFDFNGKIIDFAHKFERISNYGGNEMSENFENQNSEMVATAPESSKKKFLGVGGFWGAVLEWVVLLGIAVIIALLLRNHVFMMVHVQGGSMQNTLEEGDWLYVNRFLYSPTSADNRGDIVIFRPEQDPEKVYIKRVIAVAGDTIYISLEGNVYLNGEVIDEPFIRNHPMRQTSRFNIAGWGHFTREEPLLIEEGYIFAMGDNRNGSQDSRNLGPIPVERVKGRAVFRVFPFSTFGGIE